MSRTSVSEWGRLKPRSRSWTACSPVASTCVHVPGAARRHAPYYSPSRRDTRTRGKSGIKTRIKAVVEALIGKGCAVRILDRNVSIAQLVGANRRYIEEEIPHIASLMCRDEDELLAHADVLVIGTADEESTRVLDKATSRHVVVDLTRGGARRPSASAAPSATGAQIPNDPAHA